MSQTTVVIINFNNSKFLDKCIDSVLRNNPEKIIFVDDFSSDNSLEIAEKYDLEIIKNKENLGPVKSRNIGARRAESKYILFLDSDIVLSENYIEKTERFLENNDKAGALTGKVLEQDGAGIWYNAGYDPNNLKDYIGHPLSVLITKGKFFNFLKPIAKTFTLNFIEDETQKVDWIIEMAMFTRKDVFEKVGGFDENIFMFFEGPDYCRSVRKIGFYCFYFPEIKITHLNGHSHSKTRNKTFQKSRKYYMKKWGK